MRADLASSKTIAPGPRPALRGKDLAFSGAVAGLRAFLTYWAVECLFLSVLPWLQTPAYEYVQLHPWFVILALGVYAITGAAVGGVLALLVHRFWTKEPAALEMLGPLALAVIFIPHAAVMGLQSQLPMSLVLAVITLLSMREAIWVEDLKPIVNGWTISFAFLTYPFFIAEYRYTHTLKARQLLGVEVTIVVFAVSYAACRWIPRVQRGLSGWRSAAFWAAITAALLGFSF